MKLISWNVNGIRACMQKGFRSFFDEQNAAFEELIEKVILEELVQKIKSHVCN